MGRHNKLGFVCALVCVALVGAACGGDEEDGEAAIAGTGGTSGAGGATGGAGGGGGMGGAMSFTPLPADTAGKPCTSDPECDRGTCATMVGGLDGMPAAAPGGYCLAPCAASADCGGGGTCVPDAEGGTCYESCTMDTDCRAGYLCGPRTSTCRPAPPTDQLTDNTAGLACAADAECGDGTCLTMRLNGDPFPGGYCSGACLEDAHCGAGGVCVNFGTGVTGRCYDTCTADPDCTRDGYRCRQLTDTALGCLPTPDPLPDNITGAACATDAECGGVMGACALMLPASGGGEIAAPGGYCTTTCEIDADCGAGGVCVTTRGGVRCMKPCANETECREGYVCGERGFADPPAIVCTPFEPDAGVDMPDGGTVVDGGM